MARPRSFSRAANLVLPAALLSISPAFAQGDGSGDRAHASPDSADVIRASLVRPPPNPPFEPLDAVGLPVRIAVLPLRAIGYGLAELIGLVTLPSARPLSDIILEELERLRLRPEFGTIGPRSGQALTMRYVGLSPFFAEASLSIRGSQRHRAGILLQDGDAKLAEAAYTFHRNAEPHFWGVGPDSERKDRRDYLWDQQRLSAIGATRAGPVAISAQIAYEWNRVGRGFDGERIDLQDDPRFGELFGVNERNEYFHARLGTAFDLTYHSGFQRRGMFIELGSDLYRGVYGTDSDFHRFNLVLRGYAPLNTRQQLAVQILSEINRSDGGRGIPFTHLASLGSSRGARSLHTARMRDLDMAALMAEWRYEVWRELHERMRVESFVFFDTGAVNRRITRLDWDDLVRSYGFGFRVVPGPRTLFITYIAFGDEGPRVRLTLNWAY